ncbi:hypothetical protein [Bdellovibrio sp. HCB209]|uniref:hypothetical protein n=1 Tax=Bdellovibrio sp. HCB209 TaxID=3394354 RepID=UPI0039B5D324
MKISTQIRMMGLSVLGLMAAMPAMAGQVSGTIGVSLTIIDAGQSSTEGFSSNPADYAGGRYISALTDAANGEKVGIYLNGQQVASAISNDGVINFALNAKDTSQMNVTLKSQGREVQVLHAAYRARKNAPVPQMVLDPQVRQMQVPVRNADGSMGTQAISIKSVIVTY